MAEKVISPALKSVSDLLGVIKLTVVAKCKKLTVHRIGHRLFSSLNINYGKPPVHQYSIVRKIFAVLIGAS